jgi:hypothetical protein
LTGTAVQGNFIPVHRGGLPVQEARVHEQFFQNFLKPSRIAQQLAQQLQAFIQYSRYPGLFLEEGLKAEAKRLQIHQSSSFFFILATEVAEITEILNPNAG